MKAKALDKTIMNDIHNNLKKVVDNYKKEHIQENYNSVLIEVFNDLEQTVIVPGKLNIEKEGINLKSIEAEDGKEYFVIYTDRSFIDSENDEAFLVMTLEGVFDTLIKGNVYNGVIVDPNLHANEEDDCWPCIILKEHIIRIFESEDSN